MLKIIDNFKQKTTFSQLRLGELFTLARKEIDDVPVLIKTDEIIDDNDTNYTIMCNAVNLSTGMNWVVEEEEIVIPLKGTLEINRA